MHSVKDSRLVKRFLLKCKAGLMVHGLRTSKRSVSPCRLKEWKIRKMMDECGECRREKRKWNNHERVSLSERAWRERKRDRKQDIRGSIVK